MKFKKAFLDNALEHVPGGFLIYRADYAKEEILYANKTLIRMFDCETYEEFFEYVRGSFKGIVSPKDYDVIENEIEVQIKSGIDSFDHIYYHIITKNGNVKYIEDFGHYVEDEEEGPLFYVYLVDSDQKMLSYDVDKVTGLPGGRRLRDYSLKIVDIMQKSNYQTNFAYIYINLIHFKRFIIRYGIKSGDVLLKDVANLLKNTFPSNVVGRIGDTVFAVFAESNNIEERLKNLNRKLRNTYGYKDVLLKSGAYVLGKEDLNNLDLALDNARKACHELDYSDEVLYKIYDDEMKKTQHIYDYVITNIDEAIKEGWIRVYYQPVIRTLSGTICSAEALARWIDPQFGILSPASIIGALEDARQIHKLDEYILEQICKLIRNRISNGLSVIPISFNLSRLDFMLMDVYKVIHDTCLKYEIPHSVLKIEITESTVIDDPEGVIEVVNKLRKDGFEIWMDDFGSGYSSLGTIKDYNFDEIKLDMVFMQDFSFKSQQIIKHTISMAKSLGIQTLAEGVETEEHLEFLKSIGCEKAQGFLFSRPLPFDDMLSLLEIKNIKIEATRYSHFYDEISRIDFNDGLPMCIVNYDKNKDLFDVLFTNDALNKLLSYINIKENIGLCELLNSDSSVFGKKMRNPAYLTENVGEEKTFFYTYLGNYIRFQLKNIAYLDGQSLLVVYISNLTTEEERKTQGKLETTIRHIYSIYDEIYSVDIVKDKVDVVLNDEAYDLKISTDVFSECVDIISEKTVFEDDRELFKDFIDRHTLIKRITQSGTGYIARPIRFYGVNRQILWKMVFVILVSKTEDSKVIIVTRKFTEAEEKGMIQLLKYNITPNKYGDLSDILESAILYSDIKFFWKDKERRFLGCTNSFLDTYGIKNKNDIIGKKNEEINWDITLNNTLKDELDVLEKGKIIKSVHGVRIIKGVPHNILSTEWPVYSNGKITGILGYSIDLDDNESSKSFEQALIDKDTNLLNSSGFLDCLIKYLNETRKINSNFNVMIINVKNIMEVEMLLGKDIVSFVEKEVANVLANYFGVNSSLSHIGFGTYAIIKSVNNDEDIKDIRIKIKNILESIHEVANIPVTLFVDVVTANSIDANNSVEGFFKLFIEKFNQKD